MIARSSGAVKAGLWAAKTSVGVGLAPAALVQNTSDSYRRLLQAPPRMPPRTIIQAIEDAAKAEPHRGFRFVPDTGVPGFSGPTRGAADPSEASEASFSFAAIERMSARFGGALQALGLRKGDRVALILPNNDDFVLCFLGAIRAGIIPAPIYPPMALGQLQAYLDNTRHIVAKSGARVLITTAKIKRLLGTVQSACPALEQVVAIEGIRESTEPLKPEKVGLDDVAFLQFTCGSTSASCWRRYITWSPSSICPRCSF
jgi:fatty-acyl-CoA synthase